MPSFAQLVTPPALHIVKSTMAPRVSQAKKMAVSGGKRTPVAFREVTTLISLVSLSEPMARAVLRPWQEQS